MDNPNQPANSHSIFRNILYNFSTWILPLGLSFIATPLIVKTLGNEDYGIYALILGVVGYTFNLSFARAVTKYIAEYRVNGETDKIKEVVSASLFINIAIALFAVIIIFFSAEWLVTDVFQIAPKNHAKSITALHVSSLILFSLIVNQVFSCILQGIHRFDVYSKVFNFNNVAVLAGSILLAAYNYGIISLLVWNLLINVISGIIFIIQAKKYLPEFKIAFHLNYGYLKLILGYSVGIISYQLLGNALVLFERGWITRQLGAENLTFYVIPMTLAIYIHGFISSLIMVIFPLASELQNEPEKLLRLYLKAMKVVCFFTVFLAVTLIVESKVFLTVWLGADFADQAAALLIVHTVTFSLLAILSVSWQMIDGLGFPSYNTYIFVVCLIINVALIIVLTPKLGNMGAAVGRLAGFGTIFFSIFYVERWFFKSIQTEFWMKLIFKLSIAAIPAAIVQRIIVDYSEIDWFTFVAATVCGGIVYCGSLFVLRFITEEEKLLLRNLLAR